MPDTPLRSLIVDGVWSGVGSVIVFLPQILLLFLFIGVLEDSGYLARAALIADRTMARIGLQGKSVHPAAVGLRLRGAGDHGDAHDREQARPHRYDSDCAVHDVLGAAAGVHAGDRGVHPGKTALGPFFGTRAAALLGLYVLGFLAAIVTARLLKSTVLKSTRAPFMLEMPPYRWPTRDVAGAAADRSRQGIPAARGDGDSGGGDRALGAGESAAARRQGVRRSANSIAGMIGHAVEPAIRPLGFNWKIGDRADHVAGGARSDRRDARDDLRDGGHDRNRWACRRRCGTT